jgi:biopolymer transport protein ExbD
MSSPPKKFLDVWIIESNTVYREVPFTVVADWIQQGRLLEDDMLRPSGTAEWLKVGASPSFAPYLPKAVPHGVEDQAEAMEPVALDFSWKKSHDEEDDDVDMIPLIDVSLVLLIFFMMTASGAASMFIQTPATQNAELDKSTGGVWIGINLNDPKVPIPSYSLGTVKGGTIKSNLTQAQCLDELEQFLIDQQHPVELTIQAHEQLKASEVRSLTYQLEQLDKRLSAQLRRGKIIEHKYTGVREK